MTQQESLTSRRKFLGEMATVVAGATLLPSFVSCSGTPESTEQTTTKTPGSNSNFGGVQIGAISYSWRTMPRDIDSVIKYCQETKLSSLELMGTDLEESLGAPENPIWKLIREITSRPQTKDGKVVPIQWPPKFTPEQQAEIDQYQKDIKAWRLSLDMAKVEEARKKLNDAGIDVHIVKFSPADWSDEEIEYACVATKAMGAKAITQEHDVEAAKRLAPFAEKHGIYIAFHNHMQYAEEGFSCDPLLAVSPSIMLNFDAGHYFGSTGNHPNEMIKKYHDRIFSIHLKDKTGPTAEIPNTNQVWGQGQMPLEDVLLLIKKEKWPIYCDIELEYDVAPWSNPVKEIGTCINYARQILM